LGAGGIKKRIKCRYTESYFFEVLGNMTPELNGKKPSIRTITTINSKMNSFFFFVAIVLQRNIFLFLP
jgi:hypothetical protein